MKISFKLDAFRKSTVWAAISSMVLLGAVGCSNDDDDPELNKPVPNPYLSAPLYGITHIDSSQSDSTPYGPPDGQFTVDPSRQPIIYGGPISIMTLASTNPDYMWAVATDRVAYVNKKSGQWNRVGTAYDAPAYFVDTLGPVPDATHQAFGELRAVGMTIPQMDALLKNDYGDDYFYRVLNGNYSLVDRDNTLYATYGKGIYAFKLNDPADPSKGIMLHRAMADASVITGGTQQTRIVGLSLTYDGYLIVVFSQGMTIINRNFDIASAHFYSLGSGNEKVSNSISVDENNGIYVATNKTMRKLVWTGSGISDQERNGAWSSPYDAPDDVPPVIKFDNGTGSTPTLMGFGNDSDKLVVITDGAKRMNLVAFWRDQIPDSFVQKPGTTSRRIAGQIPVTCGLASTTEWIQSEQSVVVNGYGAFVVNNIPEDTQALSQVAENKILVVSLMGPAYPTSYGVERFQWDSAKDEWRSAWARSDVSSTSMVPVHSQLKKMALVNGYTNEKGWEVTGMDWDNGKTVHQTFFGGQNYGNGAYAILEYLENGDLLFNSIVGPMRVHYGQ